MLSSKRSILITGCSRGGVGHALALEFAARGMRVFATARSTATLSTLEDKGIEVFKLDVTDAGSIASLKDEIVKRTGGKLDMLFNNAGTMYEVPAIEADPSRVRQMFDANVFGLFDMVSAFSPLLLASISSGSNRQTPPTIINTSSILARLPFPFAAAYNASKAAVASYSDTLRIELEPLGIKVVTIFMGEVATNLMSSDNISFGSDSIYRDAQDATKERTQNHIKNSLKPEAFANQIVEHVFFKNSGYKQGEYLWKGTNAALVRLLSIIGWRKIFDGTVKQAVGFDKGELQRSIFDKGQAKAKAKQ
ncbi:Glucose/ribitol dehydrogenase [Penicillium maclennaniae]|uniref:Glucose/ribitol dehydrogenase n=1 Tax=Penicillium maclennaniae TaxID=1343394 RepID=UPI002540AB48|nr:Glucose/ribitol dehydrogenase [Penicillium maclennaniae]KAJ5668112.1 Glucose/ribitol dehydrogenase [Penicillium maclennaniae]